MDMTGRMEHYKQKYLEAIKGQQAKAASSLAVQNRLAAKPHKITDKQFAQEFYKRAKPIVHGGNE